MFRSSRNMFPPAGQTQNASDTDGAKVLQRKGDKPNSAATGSTVPKADIEGLKKRLAAGTVSVLAEIAEQSEVVTNRQPLLALVPPTIAFVKKFPLGSKERENVLVYIGNLAKGERDKDRHSELQIQLFPLAMDFLISELRDEAADAKCKEMAIEGIRRMGRNYSLKPKIFEYPGFMPVLFATIKQQVPFIVLDTCLVMMTTLCSDGSVAEGLTKHYKQQLLGVLRMLLQSEDTNLLGHAVRLIQNVSQHDDCKESLCTEQFLLDGLVRLSKNEDVNNDVVMQSLMALANLIGDDESKVDVLQGSQNGLLKLIQILENVLNGKEVHFTLETVLRPLRRLCPPDQNRNAMSPKLTPLMPLVLEHCLKIEDKIASELCFEILSQLSFDKDNLALLRENEKVKAALTQIDVLSTSEDAQQNEKWLRVARSAGVFRFNLTGKVEAQQRRGSISKGGSAVNLSLNVEESESAPAGDEGQQPQQIRLMISYQWKYQEIAKLLAILLKQQGPHISVWIDIQKMKAEVMEAMANAVSGSDYILMLVSDSYKNSSACKCEAMYAFELKKPMIPIVVEKGYTAAGWLGALIAGKLRYDCSDPAKVPDELPRVLGEIQPTVPVQIIMNKDARKSSIMLKDKGPKTVDEVFAWLDTAGFSPYSEKFKSQGIDGECLRVIRDDFVVFSQDLQHTFGMDFKTRLLFKKALNHLNS